MTNATQTKTTLAQLVKTYSLTDLDADWNEAEGLRVSYLSPVITTADQEEELEDELKDLVEDLLVSKGAWSTDNGELIRFALYLELQEDGTFNVSGDRVVITTTDFAA